MVRVLVPALIVSFVVGIAGVAAATDHDAEGTFWDALTNGKPSLNMRARVEIADADGLDQSEAYTLRTRLGYGTKSWHGGMLFVEAENTAAVATRQYFKVTEAPTGQTPIADPTNTEVNQAFIKFNDKDLLDLTAVVGRQRVILDDARFVGNVGWRQNEQTYDAALFASGLGMEDVSVAYSYVRYVRRIFGESDQALPAVGGDLKTNGHVIHGSYSGLARVKFAGFAYLLDVVDADVFSSATVGVRVHGDFPINDDWKGIWEASYAYQTDFADYASVGAGKNYGAHYEMAQLKLAHSQWGSIGGGYEVLGSDDGDQQFMTPLATGHKFNGWADVFLANGGGKYTAAAGLKDGFVSVAPKLPCGLSGMFVWHHFTSEHKNKLLGMEYDFLLKKPVNEHLTLLTKAAIFESEDALLADIWRVWLQAEVKF
ncbi:MAG: alginate export family protein [bacterium]|nr:alginate export family protein [bacterium]